MVAGASNALPLTQGTSQRAVAFPGAPGNVGDSDIDVPLVDWFRVTHEYFRAAGLRLMAGRSFNPSDVDSGLPVVVIDDVLAQQFFPDGSAVGSQAAFFGDTAMVVGVVDHARLYNVYSDDRGQVYIPISRAPTWGLSYAVRTGLDPSSLIGPVRGVIRGLDPGVPMSQVRRLDTIVRESLGQQELSLILLGGFGLGALLLATLGIYGVVSNSVVRRTQEMGVRMALGAEPGRVLAMVLNQGLWLAMVGAFLGLVGAFAASRVMGERSFGRTGRNLRRRGA